MAENDSHSLIVKIYSGLNTKRRGDMSREFLLLFVALVIGLSLVGVLNSFASTASVSAFPSSASTATLYGLIPLFLAILFVVFIAAIVIREISNKRRAFNTIDYVKHHDGIWRINITNIMRFTQT